MTTVNTRLDALAVEVSGGAQCNVRMDQLAVEVLFPFGFTPPPERAPYTRLDQLAVEVLTAKPPEYLPNFTLVYDTTSERWMEDSRGFAAYWDEGVEGSLLGGLGGALVDLETGNTDYTSGGVSNPIHVTWMSAFTDSGYPNNPKQYADVVIDINTNGAALTVSLLTNDSGSNGIAIGSVYTTIAQGRQQFVFAVPGSSSGTSDNLGIVARNIAIQLDGDVPASQPIIIYEIGIHFYVEAREAQTWDTGWSDWGSPLVKQVDLIELDIAAPAAVDLSLYSNLHSSVTAAVGPTPGSGEHTLLEVPISKFGIGGATPPADFYEGRLLRFAISTNPNTAGADDSFDSPFQLWSARARYRAIGVYVDGTNGEEWLTFPDGLGEFALVKLARIIEVDCDTTASVNLHVWTDLPGNSLGKRFDPIVIAAHSRQTQRFRVPGNTKGKLWQFQFSPTGIMRLYGLRVYARAIGSVDSDWQWIRIQIPETSLGYEWRNFPIAA